MTRGEVTNTVGFILDRDGVINVKADELSGNRYVLDPDLLWIYPDFLEFASWAGKSQKDLFVATNQQALALNLITIEDLDRVHQKIQLNLDTLGIRRIKKFYVCGHLDGTCICRKPSPGLLLSLIAEYSQQPENLVFVGDSYSDKLAADSANIRFIQIRRNPNEKIFGDECVPSLRDLIGVVR
jgi:D-glycero-D-manno-heptose 1,7-bisphosphate phosphatase